MCVSLCRNRPHFPIEYVKQNDQKDQCENQSPENEITLIIKSDLHTRTRTTINPTSDDVDIR